MKLALKMVPKGLQERAQPLVRRVEHFVRTFEWTWTKAILFSLLMWFFAFTTIAVIPSWWLYLADETLQWRSFWLLKLRDIVAIILFSVPFGGLIVVPYTVMNWRRKLRGETGDTRQSGGYR